MRWDAGTLDVGLRAVFVIALFLFILAVIILFLKPPYLLSVIELHPVVCNETPDAPILGFIVILVLVMSDILLLLWILVT